MSRNETTLHPSHLCINSLQLLVKVYGLQNRALAHTEQQAIQIPQITSIKQTNRKTNGQNYLKKRETLMNHTKSTNDNL